MKKLLVITGDHHQPDSTKRGAQYNEEDLEMHNIMVDSLRSLPGYQLEVMTDHRQFLDHMRQQPPDLVINFCDTGYRNSATLELNIPAYLELLDIPCTGAPPAAMVICYDKALVRMAAMSLGVDVPAEHFVPADGEPDFAQLQFPMLIKPNTADGSVGITKDAVVHDADQARDYLNWLKETLPGRAALMQEYLPGPEYGIGVIGNPDTGLTFLPALEVDFSALPKGLNPILSYESKALPDSPYWTDIRFKQAHLADDVLARLHANITDLFTRLQLRDYARFDFRVDQHGVIKLMEVNPNPAWASDGKLAFMAGFAGIEYPQMLGMIVETALKRVA